MEQVTQLPKCSRVKLRERRGPAAVLSALGPGPWPPAWELHSSSVTAAKVGHPLGGGTRGCHAGPLPATSRPVPE